MTHAAPVTMTALVERNSRYTAGEWEDSVAYSESKRCFAVADGASASFMAREWASTLTTSFVAHPVGAYDDDGLAGWLSRARSSFGVDGESDVPYYVRAAVERGSHATFLGVRLLPDPHGYRWEAVAVGDTVLLHLRGDRLLDAFPVDDPASFGFSPDLVSSMDNEALPAGLVRSEGRTAAGDLLLAATDALAAWALHHGERAFDVLRRVSARAFPEFVRTARSKSGLMDDDVTLLRCAVGPEEVAA